MKAIIPTKLSARPSQTKILAGVAIFILFGTGVLPNAHAYSGTTGATFLDIPVGAGPAALGSAYSALANDAYSPVWNPAGLGFLESTQVAAQHLSYLDSINYEFASIAQPLWKSTLCHTDEGCGGTSVGAAIQYLGAGDITGRDTSANLTGNFSSHYAAATLGFGKTVTQDIAIGMSGKAIQGQLDDVNALAFAGDFGLMAKPTSRLTLAAVVANIGSDLTFLNQPDPLPMAGHVSAAYQGRTWMASAEGVFQRDGLDSARLGVEWRPLSMIALRAGYRTDTLNDLSPLAGLSTGIGINVWGQELAYAWVPYGELGDTQYFSLVLRWGEMERRKRNLIYFSPVKTHRTASGWDEDSPEFQQLMQLMTYSDSKMASTELRPPDQVPSPDSGTPVATPAPPQQPMTPHTPWVPLQLQEKRP